MNDISIHAFSPFEVRVVHAENFPGETFRVLKEKEIKQFGDASQGTLRSPHLVSRCIPKDPG